MHFEETGATGLEPATSGVTGRNSEGSIGTHRKEFLDSCALARLRRHLNSHRFPAELAKHLPKSASLKGVVASVPAWAVPIIVIDGLWAVATNRSPPTEEDDRLGEGAFAKLMRLTSSASPLIAAERKPVPAVSCTSSRLGPSCPLVCATEQVMPERRELSARRGSHQPSRSHHIRPARASRVVWPRVGRSRSGRTPVRWG
jgi:hypothetical protein